MPQINRIRVNNVKYNFGTQVYDDFVMRFSCRNSIYDLANGGGKSVLMLLLLQNLIPNCTLDDKQPVEKLFRTAGVNTTIHSLIEWKLDTCDIRDGYRYMTTGFCARKGRDNGEEGAPKDTASIEYFNYCIFYKEFGDNDIKNLPLSTGSERITYNGLKAYLRDLEKKDFGVEVHIFERKGDYQNFISGYGLFESQWEIIRGINKTEGHVRTYFENSYKTTRKVVEDLLIEEIIEKSYNNRIRRDGTDDDEMAQTLLDIKDKLIELSKRRGEIDNYDKQIELLSNFAGELDKFKDVYSEKECAAEKLVECLFVCRNALADKKTEIEALEEENRQLETDYIQQDKKAALAEIEVEYVQLDELKSLTDDTLSRQDALKRTRKDLADRLRLNEIAVEYRDYLSNKAEYDKLREFMDSKDMGKDEILSQLKRLAAMKHSYVEKKKAVLAERIEKAENDEKNSLYALEASRTEEKELFADINSVKGICGELERNAAQMEEELSKLLSQCGILVPDNIADAVREQKDRLSSCRENIAMLEKSIEANKISMQNADREIIEANSSLESMYAQRTKGYARLSKCKETENKFSVMAKVYNCPKSGLLETMEQVFAGVTSQKLTVQKKLGELEAYENSIRARRLPEYDSHFAVLTEYLKGRYGDDVQSGKELLEAMDEKEALQTVRDFPFISYVIFAGECYDEIASDKVITTMNTGSHIIPIVRRETRDIAAGQWIPAYKNMDFLWNDSALASELDKLAEEKHRLAEQLDKLQDRSKVIWDDIAYVKAAQQGDDMDTVKSELDAMEKEIARLESLVEALRQSKENIDTQTNAEQQSLMKEQALNTEFAENVMLLDKAASLNQSFSDLKTRKKQSQAELAALNVRYAKAEEQLDIKERQLQEAESRKNNAKAELLAVNEDFDQRYRQYYSEEISVDKAENMDENEVDARFGALEQLAVKQAGDIADKTRLMANYQSAMNKCVQNIKYNGMDMDEADRLYSNGELTATDMSVLMELKSQISAKDKAIGELDGTVGAQNAQKNRIEGSLEHARRGYEEKYGAFERMNFDNPQNSIVMYRHKMSDIKSRINQVKADIKALENDNKDALVMEKDLERIIRNAGLDNRTPVKDIKGMVINFEAYEDLQKNYNRILRSEEKLKTDFYNSRQKLIDSLDGCHAYELAQEIRTSLKLPADNGDIETIANGLAETNRCIALERDRIEKTMSDMERIKDSFENRCIQICSNIKTELDRLPKQSKITLDDEIIPIITLAIPYIKEEMYKDRMSAYINETVSAAETFFTPEEKLKYIKGRLSWKKLFSVIVTDMNRIKLCLYKREHIKDQSRYLKYEEAVGSTGQSQGIYIQFLIAIINYISGINAIGKDIDVTGKTIFIDNPFGAAKDVYIWEPIFKMLKTNHVQLIVPARGATPAITKMFDVNYVLGQKMVSGRQQTVVVDYRSQVQADEMDYSQLDYEQATFDFI